MACAADVKTVMGHLWQQRYRRQARPPSLAESLAAEFYRRGLGARLGHSPDVKMMFAREYELRAVVERYSRAVYSGITGCPVQCHVNSEGHDVLFCA